MSRRPHFIRVNHNTEIPHDAIWVDTETVPVQVDADTERHVLNFGWACYRRSNRRDHWTAPDWFRFESIDAFWDWVESKLHGKCKIVIFAHNWAFDAPVLDVFNELPRRGWKLTGSVIESPPVILKWRDKPHTLQLIDTLNIWRVPLKALGEQLGLEKLTMPPLDASAEDWDTYGKRDTEIIMEAVIAWWKWLRAEDLGGFAPTLASQAIRTWRHRFMTAPVFIDDNEKALALSRETYLGGRTECWQIGQIEGDVYRLDINSQYPYQMRTYESPTHLIGRYGRVSVGDLGEWVEKYCITARVLLETDEPVYPIVDDKRLIFPTGRFEACLATPELVYALKAGHIRRVTEAAVYDKAHLFTEYVDYFYKLRKQLAAKGDRLGAFLCKIMLNSLYGKFGQRGFVYSLVDETADLSVQVWSEVDLDTGELDHYRQYAGIIERLERRSESMESHPAIAAHITSHARMHLWRLVQLAGRENVYYMDTDCVWTNKEGCKRLKGEIHPNRLGALKLEGVNSTVTIHAPKDYVLDGARKTKGIRAKADEIEPGVFVQDRFSSLKGLMREGDLTAPRVTRTTKRLVREYMKGKVGPGGRVSPFELTR